MKETTSLGESSPGHARLTSGRLLARNTLWSLLGQATPVLVAVVAIPYLVRALGVERFGLLTLAWTVVGYFSLFDLGLGWALTRLVSEKLAVGHDHEIPTLVWTSLALLFLLGILGGIVMALISPWLVSHALRVPLELQEEARHTFYWLAASLPVVIGTASLAGVLAAHQRFALLNAVRLPMGAFSFLGPLLVLPFSHQLTAVVAVLVLGRVVGWIVHLVLCLRVIPALRHRLTVRWEEAGPLIRFGGWMTVSNVVGPLMVYFDRLLIGAMISIASVAYYATPYDVVTRLWLLSSPVVAVLFPAFAASFASDRARTSRLFAHGLRYAFVVLFPLTLTFAVLAREGLTLWLGPEFASHGARVLQWLALGVLVNGLAQVALSLVQSVGRPDLSARLHAVELPFYLAGVWWLIRTHGIEGAAIAWVARVVLDAAALFIMAFRLLSAPAAAARKAALVIAPALAAQALAFVLPGTAWRIAFLVLALGIYAVAAWQMLWVPGRKLAAELFKPLESAS